MAVIAASEREVIRQTVVGHLLDVLERTPAETEPFSHIYLTGVFPRDIYARMLESMPQPGKYTPLCLKKHSREDGTSTRDVLALDGDELAALPDDQREFWAGISAGLASVELKRAVFRKLAPDLAMRFGVPEKEVERIPAYPRPSLFRDLEGYAIAPHPDGRAKIVTMQLYLPRDRSQIDLGTALYRRRLTSLRGLVSWKGRFEKVKQFDFLPNTGYAFAVSNSMRRKSWHGREEVPEGSGVRNTMLNIYFAERGRRY